MQSEDPSRSTIRICIIDTGINLDDHIARGHKNRIFGRKSWVGAETDTNDECGHGTHIARLILGNISSAGLLIAKVTNDKIFSRSNMGNIVEVSALQI